MAFNRKLSGPFRKKLLNVGRPLLDALQPLDLRIRDDEVNFYKADKSLVKVSLGALTVHQKFVARCELSGRDTGDYVVLPFTESSVKQFVEQLPAILENVERLGSNEGPWEEALVRANTASTPVAVLDRQIRLPGDTDRRRLDLVAVTTKDVPTLVAIELKYGLDNRIQDVPEQLHKYLEMLDPHGLGLSRDIATAYRIACLQLRSLGRPAPDAGLLRPGMPVRGLLVLAKYNPKSALLGRARQCARALPRPMFLWTTSDKNAQVPPPSEWEALQ